MTDKRYWMGTATDLLTEMNDTKTPTNIVTKLLNKFSFELYCSSGIDVNFRNRSTTTPSPKTQALGKHRGLDYT